MGWRAGSSKSLRFDPCALHYFESGEYLVVAGSNREAHLMTSEGVFLYTITTERRNRLGFGLLLRDRDITVS